MAKKPSNPANAGKSAHPATVPTLNSIARATGVSRQTVISLEKGRYDPSLPLAFRLAAVFGRRIEDLFTPDGNAG